MPLFNLLPLSKEQAYVLYDDARVKILAGGEGSSKSLLEALEAVGRSVHRAYENQLEPQLVWIVGADFEDARTEFDYILDFCDILRIAKRSESSISTIRKQQVILSTTLNITFKTVSAFDPLKISREDPDGVLGAEVSRYVDIEVYRRIKGRLIRKYPHSWAVLGGSYEGQVGWFPDLVKLGEGPNEEGIKSYILPSWANPYYYPGGEEDPKIQLLKETEPPLRFLERYAGIATPPTDSMFPEAKAILHVSEIAELDPNFPVYLFMDPGDRFIYAIEFVQFIGDEVHVVDEVYVSRHSHAQVIQATQLKPAWAQKALRGHVADIAAQQHHYGMPSALEAWYADTAINFEGRKRTINEVVEKLRSVLGLNPVTLRPRLLVHPRCRGLIAEFGIGPPPIPGVGRWREIRGRPENKNDHATKALGYGLLFHFGAQSPTGEAFKIPGQEPKGLSYLTPMKPSAVTGSYLSRPSPLRRLNA